MLGERSLLNLKLAVQSVADLEAFRDKYQYVLSAIPIDELPKERTLFNHLVDELAKCTAMKSKVDKAIEASGSSHRRSTSWLWAKVRNAIDLDQQKRNRDGFEKNLKLKPTVLTSTTSQKDDVPANPAETKKKRSKKAGKKEEKSAAKSTAPAAPAPSGKPPGGPPPKGKQGGDLTPRSNAVSKTAKMTPAEKAKVPCMFFAYNCCYAKQCAFSHDPNRKYTGPPPKSISKAKGQPSAPAAVAPLIPAVPAITDNKVTWLWDTAAGRHLIGRQALSSVMHKCVRPSSTPVGFATGGGAQQGNTSLAFQDSNAIPPSG